MKIINKKLVESLYPPLNHNGVLWVDKDESSGDWKSIKEYHEGKGWEDLIIASTNTDNNQLNFESYIKSIVKALFHIENPAINHYYSLSSTSDYLDVGDKENEERFIEELKVKYNLPSDADYRLNHVGIQFCLAPIILPILGSDIDSVEDMEASLEEVVTAYENAKNFSYLQTGVDFFIPGNRGVYKKLYCGVPINELTKLHWVLYKYVVPTAWFLSIEGTKDRKSVIISYEEFPDYMKSNLHSIDDLFRGIGVIE